MIERVSDKNVGGMTLTEVLIALALVALSVGSIMAVLIQSVGLGQTVDKSYVAVNLAKSRIELMRQFRKDMGYSMLDGFAETDTAIDINGDGKTDFSRTTIVDDGYETNLTKVIVRVKYKVRDEFSGDLVELVTLISAYE